MPTKMTKKGALWQVRTPNGIKSKGSSKKNALAQVRLLNAVDHGWKPTKRKKK